MDAKENGQMSAYPTPREHEDNGYGQQVVAVWETSGLTKREAFAMAALQGLCAAGRTFGEPAAIDAVLMADALLAELAKAK